MLHFGGVLKPTVNDSSKAFRLENKILETGCVNSYIMTPEVDRCVRELEIGGVRRSGCEGWVDVFFCLQK